MILKCLRYYSSFRLREKHKVHKNGIIITSQRTSSPVEIDNVAFFFDAPDNIFRLDNPNLSRICSLSCGTKLAAKKAKSQEH